MLVFYSSIFGIIHWGCTNEQEGRIFNIMQIQCYSAVSDFAAGHHKKSKCLLFRKDPIQIPNFVLLVHETKLGTPSSHASQTQKHSAHVLM